MSVKLIDIPPFYTLSYDGVLKNTKTGKTLKGSKKDKTPHIIVKLRDPIDNKSKDNSIAQLVYENFCEKLPEDYTRKTYNIFYKDDDIYNCSFDNLELLTLSQSRTRSAIDRKKPEKFQRDYVNDLPEDCKSIGDFEGIDCNDYYINPSGDTYSLKGTKVLKMKQNIGEYGYHSVTFINTKVFKIHRLVYHVFGPTPLDPNLTINHIDENKSNNHISNLEQISRKDNVVHSQGKEIILFGLNGLLQFRTVTEVAEHFGQEVSGKIALYCEFTTDRKLLDNRYIAFRVKDYTPELLLERLKSLNSPRQNTIKLKLFEAYRKFIKDIPELLPQETYKIILFGLDGFHYAINNENAAEIAFGEPKKHDFPVKQYTYFTNKKLMNDHFVFDFDQYTPELLFERIHNIPKNKSKKFLEAYIKFVGPVDN
jgi:hypothetical protein